MSENKRPGAVTRLLAAAAAVTLTAAACGGTDEAGVEASRNPALTKSEIKIGLLISLTGSTSSSDKRGAPVARAWEKWINAGSGIAGHPVKVVIKDDKGDGASSVAAARELVADKSVLSLTSQVSGTETAASGYLKDQDIAVIGATGYNPKIWGTLPNYFSIVPPSSTYVAAQFAAAKAVGSDRWTAAYCAENANCKASAPYYQPASQRYGISYAGSFAVSLSAPNYTAECLKMKDLGTNFLQIGFAPAGAEKFVNDCKAQGYDGWYGATAGSVGPDFEDIDDIRLAGGLQGFPWWADDPKVKQFRESMDKYEPDAGYQTPSATSVWASLELARKAMAKVGDNPTRQDVIKGMHGLEDEDLGGLLPQKMNYTKGEGAPAVNCLWLYKRENDEYSTLSMGPSGNTAASGDLKSSCLKPLG